MNPSIYIRMAGTMLQIVKRARVPPYHQRSKAETIFSVIKRMFGDTVMSRGIVTQNREMMYRLIAYNCYRINRNYVLILGVFYMA